jgi:hypothetical protein
MIFLFAMTLEGSWPCVMKVMMPWKVSGLITLCRVGNRLAILAVLLYMPSDLDKMSSLEGIFVQILDDTLFLIVKDEVIGNESLDNRFTRWISVMIDFVLSGLGIFAQARSDVVT